MKEDVKTSVAFHLAWQMTTVVERPRSAGAAGHQENKQARQFNGRGNEGGVERG